MGKIVRLRKMEDTLGTAFPRELMDRLGMREGGAMHVEERDGGLFLQPVDPDFQETMEAFEEIHREFYDAFRELAK